MKMGMKHFDKVIDHILLEGWDRTQIKASRSMIMGKYCPIHKIHLSQA
jgi:hypothetical protein